MSRRLKGVVDDADESAADSFKLAPILTGKRCGKIARCVGLAREVGERRPPFLGTNGFLEPAYVAREFGPDGPSARFTISSGLRQPSGRVRFKLSQIRLADSISEAVARNHFDGDVESQGNITLCDHEKNSISMHPFSQSIRGDRNGPVSVPLDSLVVEAHPEFMGAFSAANAFSGFSVDSIDEAFAFYSEKLGMTVARNTMGFLDIHLAGGGSVLVYSKPNHEPASFTILNFPVADVDAAVAELNERGVVTKIYTDPHFGTDERGIAHGGPGRGPTIAWFRDPAGNVLSVMSES